MLKKLLNIDGAVLLSKKAQEKIKGGVTIYGCKGGIENCPTGQCCSKGVCKDRNKYPCE